MSKFLIAIFILTQILVLSHGTPDETSDEEKNVKGYKQITDFSNIRTVKEEHTYMHSHEGNGENKNEDKKEDKVGTEDTKIKDDNEEEDDNDDDDDDDDVEDEDYDDDDDDDDDDRIEDQDQLWTISNMTPVLTTEEKNKQQLKEIIDPSDAKMLEEEHIALHKDENGLIDYERYIRWPGLENKTEEELSAVCEKFLSFIPHISKLETEEIIYKHLENNVIMAVRILECKVQYTHHLLEAIDNDCVYYARKLKHADKIHIESKICKVEESINIRKLVQNAIDTISNMVEGNKRKSVTVSNSRPRTGTKDIKGEKEIYSKRAVIKEKGVHYATLEQSNQEKAEYIDFYDGLSGRKYKPVKDLYK